MISWTDLLSGSLKVNPQRYSPLNKRPEVVVWNITSHCNLACQHCYFEAKKIRDCFELNQKQTRDFICDLAKLKVGVLLFSGGEPLLRKDIFKLAKFAKDKGMKVALSTNGTLITEEVAGRIKDAGLYYVGVSIDGMKDTNDNFRNCMGAFEASLSGIRHCQKIGLKVGLRFTLTRDNVGDLAAIFDMVEKESIPRLCIYHLVYSGRGANLKDKDLSHQEKREALELIWQKILSLKQRDLKIEILTVDNHADGVWIYLKLRKINPKAADRALGMLKAQGGNSSGIRIAAVDNRGNVYPDQFWRTHVLGNIRKKSFSEIWRDEENDFLLALRNRKPLLKGRCLRCNFFNICNGNFRCRAECFFGDPWSEDPACYLTEDEISQKWD